MQLNSVSALKSTMHVVKENCKKRHYSIFRQYFFALKILHYILQKLQTKISDELKC